MISPPPGASIPPPPGSPRDYRDRDLELWNYLSNRPQLPLNIPSGTGSVVILGRPCVFAGWSLRETTGTAAAQVEFVDGGAAGGVVVGEETLPAPLPGSVGNIDVDVDFSSQAAAAAQSVTLAAAAGATTFITGFEITGTGATAQSVNIVAVSGILGGTKTYYINIPAGATTSITPLIVEYSRPIPASALNTAIVVTVPSFGAGNTNAAVTAHGFQRTAGSTSAQTGVSIVRTTPGPGVLCRGGLFLRVISGSVVGSAWVRV